METHWLLLAATGAAFCAVGWGACHWWHRRHAAVLWHRISKLERARHAAQERIQRLQKDLLESRRSLSLAAAQREKSRRREALQRDAAVPTLDPSEAIDHLPRPRGFEDTLPM